MITVVVSMCDNRGGHDGYLAYIGEYGDTYEQAEEKVKTRIKQLRQEGAKAERDRIAEKLKFEACPAHHKDGFCPSKGISCSQCWLEYLEVNE